MLLIYSYFNVDFVQFNLFFVCFCSNLPLKQTQHTQRFQTITNERLSSAKHNNPHDEFSHVQGNLSTNNAFAIQPNGTNGPDNIDGQAKILKKGFDTSAFTSRINLMGVAVSRTSLSRRLSSNNSPSETPIVERSNPIADSDTSTNSSSTSGFSLNMFHSKKPFIMKPFPKQQQEQIRLKESRYMQSEASQFRHDLGRDNNQRPFLQGKVNEEQHVSTPRSSNINLTIQHSQVRPSPSLFPGTSGFARLHDFADPLPSPASAVASLTRDLESDLNQLELRDWAVQGQYVVKPQVT